MASRTVEVYGTITESTVNVFLHILYLVVTDGKLVTIEIQL